MKSATVGADCKITIPNDIMNEFNINKGDQILFIKENGNLILKKEKNSLKPLQDLMAGEADKMGWKTTEDTDEFMKNIRTEYANERRKLN